MMTGKYTHLEEYYDNQSCELPKQRTRDVMITSIIMHDACRYPFYMAQRVVIESKRKH